MTEEGGGKDGKRAREWRGRERGNDERKTPKTPKKQCKSTQKPPISGGGGAQTAHYALQYPLRLLRGIAAREQGVYPCSACASSRPGSPLSLHWRRCSPSRPQRLPPPPTTAQEPDGVPERLTLNLELLDDSDGYVQAGSTISIRGQVRLQAGSTDDLQLSAGDLRLTADQAWEQNDRARLPLNDQRLIAAAIHGPPSSEATASGDHSGNGQELRVIAYDGKTAVARTRGHRLFVFNTETGTQLANLSFPPQSGNRCIPRFDGASTCVNAARTSEVDWGWGRQSDDDLGGAVAIWQEDDDTAWLFIGAHRAQQYADATNNPYTWNRVGALFIYEVNYQPATPTINLRRRIPGVGPNWRAQGFTFSEMKSKGIQTSIGQDNMLWYGSAVAVSADGSTLAVGAPLAHDVGAVYVYDRPSGGWGAALGWNDAVRVEPVAIPAWGNNASHHPFQPQATGRTGARTDCDAYCSRVSSYSGDVVDGNNQAGGARFGAQVALSGDGSVLAVSAPFKRWASDTPGGSGAFRGTPAAHGEVLIFTEPAGGWSAVPNYKTGRSHLAWNANAASFDPTLHYGTGPNKRVNEPTWTFSFPWNNQQAYLLGQKLALSDDGTVLAANDRINDAVNLFEVDSPEDWANGPTAPTAQLTGVTDGGLAGEIGFSPDGLAFAIGDPTHNSNQGRVLVFERPFTPDGSWDGDWESADAADAEVLLAPTGQRVANDRFGRSLAWGSTDPDAPRLASLAVNAAEAANNGGSQVGPGRFWTVSRNGPLDCPLTTSTDTEGTTTRTTVCAIDLGDASIVIPTGTPDGPFTISGSVTLRYGNDADGQPLTVTRTANIELQIGDVQEVAKVRMDFAVNDGGTPNDVRDDRPYPSELSASGASTVLRLQILNEHDKASAAGSVASVIVTANAGSLSTDFGGGCVAGGGGVSCRLDASLLGPDNADNIPITLTHPGREGTARISALVIATDGMSYESEPQEVVLAGTPRELEIAEPAVDLLNIDTPDSGADKDDRDVLTLTVTAMDRIGNPVRAANRNYSYRITGPDDKRVASSKIAVEWPIRGGPNCVNAPDVRNPGGATIATYTGTGTTASSYVDGRATVAICLWDGTRWRAYLHGSGDEDFTITTGARIWSVAPSELLRELVLTADNQPQIRLNVNAAATAALASGEYTLEVRQAGLPWVSQTIRLAGVPAAISFAPLDAPMPNQRFTVTAAVNDADGNPVPNGTPIEWSAVQPTGGATLVRLGADLTTTDGAATSTWLAATPGSAWVRAESGAQQQLLPVATAVRQVAPLDLLSRGAAPGFGVWLGTEPILASELVTGVEGVNGVSVLRTNPSRWLTYAVDNGQLRQGSLDYPINPGAVYWLE